jgi:hypothetical protein
MQVSGIKEIHNPEQKKYNQDGNINFGIYHIDEQHGFGYEVIKKETLKREHGFKTAEEARKAGFEAAKKIIHEIED